MNHHYYHPGPAPYPESDLNPDPGPGCRDGSMAKGCPYPPSIVTIAAAMVTAPESPTLVFIHLSSSIHDPVTESIRVAPARSQFFSLGFILAQGCCDCVLYWFLRC